MILEQQNPRSNDPYINLLSRPLLCFQISINKMLIRYGWIMSVIIVFSVMMSVMDVPGQSLVSNVQKKKKTPTVLLIQWQFKLVETVLCYTREHSLMFLEFPRVESGYQRECDLCRILSSTTKPKEDLATGEWIPLVNPIENAEWKYEQCCLSIWQSREKIMLNHATSHKWSLLTDGNQVTRDGCWTTPEIASFVVYVCLLWNNLEQTGLFLYQTLR